MAAEKISTLSSESKAEKASRVLRNLNGLGAIALFGIGAIAPAGAIAFNTLAAINVAQVGGFEAARRWAKKKRLQKILGKK